MMTGCSTRGDSQMRHIFPTLNDVPAFSNLLNGILLKPIRTNSTVVCLTREQ